MKNLILNTDSYKASHYAQYPAGTTMVNSYIEARGANDPELRKVVFFGLQMFIREYLERPITMADVEEAKDIFEAHGEPFNYDGWKYIVEKCNGYLPIEIEAVPEGTVVPVGNVLAQVRNTDPNVPWLTSYIETALLRAIWYPTTVATYSWAIKQKLKAYAEKSGSDMAGVAFKLHDFGARGVSSNESAAIGGIAHLVNFMGTDTIAALVAGRNYYGIDMAGFSIPAAEHSTITSWGKEGEVDAYRNMLKQFANPGSLVAVVSDSYDIYNAVDNIWGEELKQEVLDSGATIVVRPDSGDPTVVPIEVIKRLMDKYGFSVNEKGYKTLPSNIRVIQGDGVNKESISEILDKLDAEKLSLDNIAFGMGGALLQQVNRDTLKFAMKASAIIVNDTFRDVFKQPITDSVKASKAGIQGLFVVDGQYVTRKVEDGYKGILQKVYKNGQMKASITFEKVRENSNRSV